MTLLSRQVFFMNTVKSNETSHLPFLPRFFDFLMKTGLLSTLKFVLVSGRQM